MLRADLKPPSESCSGEVASVTHDKTIERIAVSSCGRLVAVACGSHKMAMFYFNEKKKMFKQICASKFDSVTLRAFWGYPIGFGKSKNLFAFVDDSLRIYSYDQDYDYDNHDERENSIVPFNLEFSIDNVGSSVEALEFNRASTKLILANRSGYSVCLVDVEMRVIERQMRLDRSNSDVNRVDCCQTCTWSQNEKVIAGGGNASDGSVIFLFSAATGELLRLFNTSHKNWIYDIRFIHNDNFIISCNKSERYASVTNVNTLEKEFELDMKPLHLADYTVSSDESTVIALGREDFSAGPTHRVYFDISPSLFISPSSSSSAAAACASGNDNEKRGRKLTKEELPAEELEPFEKGKGHSGSRVSLNPVNPSQLFFGVGQKLCLWKCSLLKDAWNSRKICFLIREHSKKDCCFFKCFQIWNVVVDVAIYIPPYVSASSTQSSSSSSQYINSSRFPPRPSYIDLPESNEDAEQSQRKLIEEQESVAQRFLDGDTYQLRQEISKFLYQEQQRKRQELYQQQRQELYQQQQQQQQELHQQQQEQQREHVSRNNNNNKPQQDAGSIPSRKTDNKDKDNSSCECVIA